MRNSRFVWIIPLITSLLLLVLLATTYSASAFASVYIQDLPPPPPAKDYFPNTWDEYSFPAGQFRIRLPKKPEETVVTQENFEVHVVQHKGLITYRVSYVDYKVPIDDPQKVKEMLQGLETVALNAIREKGVQVIAEREVNIDGHAGIFVHLEVAAREVIRMQWVAAGSRLYAISAESRKGSPRELEGADDFEKVAMGFISSFHVIP
jgi:hypothetical protein